MTFNKDTAAWVWNTTGESVQDEHWETGQPDTECVNEDENCVYSTSGEWDDGSCSNEQYSFVCETDTLIELDDGPAGKVVIIELFKRLLQSLGPY